MEAVLYLLKSVQGNTNSTADKDADYGDDDTMSKKVVVIKYE